MRRPLAVVVGFIGKLPMAGMMLYNLHYILGLQDLGYDVHYVEQQNSAEDYYDPRLNEMTSSVIYGREYVRSNLDTFGIGVDRFSIIDIDRSCHGSGWDGLEAALAKADFVLNLADATWFDELERCPKRAFVDGDPVFTQAAMLSGGPLANTISKYEVLFTYCNRMGKADCFVPSAGREWFATRPVVSTRLWRADVPEDPALLPMTNLMNWSAGAEPELRGQIYRQKGPELERFITIPLLARGPFVLALGGGDLEPRQRLRQNAWIIVDPLSITASFEAYSGFINRSRADFGIAKHAYVASRSGWFSDRATCYLASGRPVLHQDTGFDDWLPVGEGVLIFATIPEALDALKELDANYAQHARAARSIAEEHFEARTVIGRMLDEAAFR
jgi:hypothetical protein